MKILVIHNKYKQSGGEDSVVENETSLLKKNGNIVQKLIFCNTSIDGFISKIKAGSGAIFNFASYHRTIKIIETLRPDVIHVHNFFPIASPSIFFAADKYNVPVVMTLHNYRLLCVNALFFRNSKVCVDCISKTFPGKGVLMKCYRNSHPESLVSGVTTSVHKILGTWDEKINKYIALSEFSKDIFCRSSLKLPEYKIEVKPNFTFGNFENVEKDQYYLFAGRLSKEKGIDVLLEAFRQTSLYIKIIGDGPCASMVKEYAEENSNIDLLGLQSKKKVVEMLKKAKALIFPSICFENCPMIILEAFSTGTPVISSDIGGGAELVDDYVNGLHFKNRNPEDLIRVLHQFDENRELQLKLMKNAVKSYTRKYTPEKNCKRLMDIYNSVLRK